MEIFKNLFGKKKVKEEAVVPDSPVAITFGGKKKAFVDFLSNRCTSYEQRVKPWNDLLDSVTNIAEANECLGVYDWFVVENRRLPAFRIGRDLLIGEEKVAVTIQELCLLYKVSHQAGFPDIAARTAGRMLDGNFRLEDWQEVRTLFPRAESKMGRIALIMIKKKAVSRDEILSAFLFLDAKSDAEAEREILGRLSDQIK